MKLVFFVGLYIGFINCTPRTAAFEGVLASEGW